MFARGGVGLRMRMGEGWDRRQGSLEVASLAKDEVFEDFSPDERKVRIDDFFKPELSNG
jgi:hypothetical protein